MPTEVENHSEEAEALLTNAYHGGGDGLTQEQAIEAAKVLALARRRGARSN
jgi:hypothetical protein